MSEVGVSIAVTPDSRKIPSGDRTAEDMLREAMSRRYPTATDVEIEWMWEDEFQHDGIVIPPRWIVMARAQVP